MPKNSRMKSISYGPTYDGTRPIFITKGKTKKLKKDKKVKRERNQRMNNVKMDFNKRGKR